MSSSAKIVLKFWGLLFLLNSCHHCFLPSRPSCLLYSILFPYLVSWLHPANGQNSDVLLGACPHYGCITRGKKKPQRHRHPWGSWSIYSSLLLRSFLLPCLQASHYFRSSLLVQADTDQRAACIVDSPVTPIPCDRHSVCSFETMGQSVYPAPG